ncbi:MAG: DedA family protein [Candidatus Gracilibacteria bacterium]|nr:DedA family protein [Candidatus Gracilibacteria bacterium]MDQ7022724.1 DedA family protein [Candidatus Gracilibacteria bacterium]
MKKKILKKIFLFLINLLIKLSILLVFISIYLSFFEKELLKLWVGILKEFILSLGMWNYPLAFFSSLIESFPVLGMALPSQNILIAIAGFFGENNYLNLFFIILISTIGAILGNFIGYFLGVKYGEEFIEKYGMWIGITGVEVKYLKKSLDKWGALGITLGKFHPMTRTFLPFVAGMSGMTNKKFAFYNILGSFIWSFTMIVLGVLFAKYYEIIIDHSGKIMLLIMLITGLYIWKYKKPEFKKYMKEKNEEMERKFPSK